MNRSYIVRQFIESQEVHDRKISSQDEFIVLLKKHNIEHDQRCLWEKSTVPVGLAPSLMQTHP